MRMTYWLQRSLRVNEGQALRMTCLFELHCVLRRWNRSCYPASVWLDLLYVYISWIRYDGGFQGLHCDGVEQT
jgi:hypothetical protein